MNCDLIVYLVMYFTKYKIFLILYIFVFCLGFYSYMIIRRRNISGHISGNKLGGERVKMYIMYIMYKKVRNTLTNYGGFR